MPVLMPMPPKLHPMSARIQILVEKNHRVILDVFENIILWIMQGLLYLADLFLVKSFKSRLFSYDYSTGASADAGANFGFQKKIQR